jgi:kinesin family member 15
VPDSPLAFTATESDSENIKVHVRIRPPVERETKVSFQKCVSVRNKQTIVLDAKPEPKYFTFDFVGDQDSTQEEIFRSIGKNVVETCLQGYNGTIFAYGQTGSGKTYTMQGVDDFSDASDLTNCSSEQRGLIPRVFEYLFALIARNARKSGGKVSCTCKCSFIEIYNEQIIDLLNEGSSSALNLREDTKKGVYIENVNEETVESPEDTYRLLALGAHNRHIGSTNMNRESSRSHSVFTIKLETIHKATTEGGISSHRFAFLNLIDLAGSERQKSTDAVGSRLKEACSINRSLSALGNVITNLVDISNGKLRHVHYRDSKLTFLLKDSLGGNAKTSIVATVSPAAINFGETLSTLKFAQRAKNIKNKVSINQVESGSVEQLQEQVRLLKLQLSKVQHGGAVLPASVSSAANAANAVAAAAAAETPSKAIKQQLQYHPAYQSQKSLVEHDNIAWDNNSSTKGLLHTRMHQLEAFLLQTLQCNDDLEKKIHTMSSQLDESKELSERKEKQLQSSRMIIRLRDGHIDRLQRKSKSNTAASETDVGQEQAQDLAALKEELSQVRAQLKNHPEVTRFALENLELRDAIQAFRDNYGEKVEADSKELSSAQEQLRFAKAQIQHLLSDKQLLQQGNMPVTAIEAPLSAMKAPLTSSTTTAFPTTPGNPAGPANGNGKAAELANTVQELHEELDAARGLIHQLRGQLQQAQSDSEAAKARHQGAIQQLEEQLENSRKNAGDMEMTLTSIKLTQEAEMTALQNSQAEAMRALQESYQQSLQQLQAAEQSHLSASEKEKLLSLQLNEVREEMQALIEGRAQSVARAHKQAAALSEATLALDQAQSERDIFMADLADVRGQLRKLEGQKEEEIQQKRKLTTELAAAQTELAEAHSQWLREKETVGIIRQELKQFQTAAEEEALEMEEKLRRAGLDATEVQSELESLREAMEVAESERAFSDAQQETLRQQLQQQGVECEGLQRELRAKEEQLREAREAFSHQDLAQADNMQLRARNAELEAAMHDEHLRVQAVEEQLNSLERESGRMHEEWRGQLERSEAKQKQYESTARQLEASQARLSELEEHVQALQAERDSKEGTYQEEMDAMNDDMLAYQMESRSLMWRLERQRDQFREATSSMQEQIHLLRERQQADRAVIDETLQLWMSSMQQDMGRLQKALPALPALSAKKNAGDDDQGDEGEEGQGEMHQAEEALENMARALVRTQKDQDAAADELAQLQGDYQAATQQVARQQEEIAECKRRLQQFVVLSNKWESSRVQKKQEIEQLERQLEEIRPLAAQCQEAEKVAALSREAEKEALQRLGALTTDMQQLMGQIAELKQVNASLTEKSATERQQLAASLEERKQWIEEMQMLREEEERTFQQCESERSKAAGLSEQCTQLQESLKVAEDKLNDLEAQNAQLIGHQNIKQKVQLHLRIKQENNLLVKEKAEVEEELASVRAAQRTLQQEVKRLRGKCGESDEEAQQATHLVESLQQQVQQLEGQRTQLSSSLTSLTTALLRTSQSANLHRLKEHDSEAAVTAAMEALTALDTASRAKDRDLKEKKFRIQLLNKQLKLSAERKDMDMTNSSMLKENGSNLSN